MGSVYIGGVLKNQTPHPQRIVPPHLQVYFADQGEAVQDPAARQPFRMFSLDGGRAPLRPDGPGREGDGRARTPGDTPGTVAHHLLTVLRAAPGPMSAEQFARVNAGWQSGARSLRQAGLIKRRSYLLPGLPKAIWQFTLSARPWPPAPAKATQIKEG